MNRGKNMCTSCVKGNGPFTECVSSGAGVGYGCMWNLLQFSAILKTDWRFVACGNCMWGKAALECDLDSVQDGEWKLPQFSASI